MKNKLILCTFISLACVCNLPAQYFTYHSNAPFGLQLRKPDMTRAAQQIMFYDYDGDGDQDAFLSGIDRIDDFDNWEDFHFFIEMQPNVGTKYAPQFGDRIAVVDSFPYPVGYFMASIGDLNGDLLPDFITGVDVDPYLGTQKQQLLIQNTPPLPPGFTVSNLDQFGLTEFVPESFFKPELVDLDSDGDLDLMNSGFNSAFGEEDGPNVPLFYYARNVGTPSNPDFEGWYPNPYGLMPDPNAETITSGDIDNDGDIDFVGGLLATPIDSNFYLTVHINTPDSNGRPGFNMPLHSPFEMPVSFGELALTFPELADLDGDGDQDLFVFRGSNITNMVLEYYENDLCHSSADVTETICEGESIVVGGMEFNAAGVYTIHTTAHNQCDSVIHLVLSVDPFVEVLMQTTICPGESVTVGGMTFTETGQYMLTVPGNNGCDTLIMLDLTVDPLHMETREVTICNGAEYHIGDHTFTVPGHYVVVVSAAVGCDTLVHLTLGTEVLNDHVVLNGTLLTAEAVGVSYQWIVCGSNEPIAGATGQSYEATVTGSYAVMITSSSGCVAQSLCMEVVVTGVSDEVEETLLLFPNPTNSNVHIQGIALSEIEKITVMDVTGKKMITSTTDLALGFDMSEYGVGVYFVVVEVGGKVYSGRVVVF